MSRALALVHAQAEDEGLWFVTRTMPEAVLQAALRALHAAVEDPGEGTEATQPRPEILGVCGLEGRVVHRHTVQPWEADPEALGAAYVCRRGPRQIMRCWIRPIPAGVVGGAVGDADALAQTPTEWALRAEIAARRAGDARGTERAP